MRIAFFTVNDFAKDDGGTLRMRGIINGLCTHDARITLFSNTQAIDKFHGNVSHVHLGLSHHPIYRKVFKTLLAFTPRCLVKLYFKAYLKKIAKKIHAHLPENTPIIFSESLDNAFGYALKQSGLIRDYWADLHGIGPLEFSLYPCRHVFDKCKNKIKYLLQNRLDKLAYKHAKGLLCLTTPMKKYLIETFPFLETKPIIVINDAATNEICQQKIDQDLLLKLRSQLQLTAEDQVVFFAGEFKWIGGVTDLIQAFSICAKHMPKLKLIVIGSGEEAPQAEKLAQAPHLQNRILFLGRIPYKYLKTYQQLADVIVCPDRQHPFSNLVPHIKYFDSLLSGKIVINGSFDSIQELNNEDLLSVSFEPSNVKDLAEKIQYCITEQKALKAKYQNSSQYILDHYQYSHTVKPLLTLQEID